MNLIDAEELFVKYCILEKRFVNESNKIGSAPMFIYISGGTTKEIINVKKIRELTKRFKFLVTKYNIEDNY